MHAKPLGYSEADARRAKSNESEESARTQWRPKTADGKHVDPGRRLDAANWTLTDEGRAEAEP